MSEMIEFSIYGTQDNFCDDFQEINEQLAPYNARFVMPSGLGAGIPIDSIIHIFLPFVTEASKLLCLTVVMTFLKCGYQNYMPNLLNTQKKRI